MAARPTPQLLDELRDVLCAFLEGRHDEDEYAEAVLEANDCLLLPLSSESRANSSLLGPSHLDEYCSVGHATI